MILKLYSLAMKRKVLIVCDKNPCTSFGRLTLDIHTALSNSLFAPEILWLLTPKYFPEGAPSKGDFLKASSLETGFFAYKRSFSKYLQKNSPDIVLFIRPELGFLCPIPKKLNPTCKTIVMVHDTFAETLYPNSLKFKIINQFFIKKTSKADTFIFNSQYTENESNSYFGKPSIPGKIVGCPISSGFLKEHPPVSKEHRQIFWKKQGIQGFEHFCLNVSLDEPRKNLQTFFQLAKNRPEIAFIRIGRLRKQTEAHVESLGLKNLFHFHSLEFNTLIDFYRHASVFIYPSFLEGFGLPPLEALACNTPVIAADTSALKENLEGIVPLVSPPDNIKEYEVQLDKILNQEQVISKDSLQGLLQKFSPDSFAKNLSEFLASMK